VLQDATSPTTYLDCFLILLRSATCTYKQEAESGIEPETWESLTLIMKTTFKPYFVKE
jgi:hypothetical protein